MSPAVTTTTRPLVKGWEVTISQLCWVLDLALSTLLLPPVLSSKHPSAASRTLLCFPRLSRGSSLGPWPASAPRLQAAGIRGRDTEAPSPAGGIRRTRSGSEGPTGPGTGTRARAAPQGPQPPKPGRSPAPGGCGGRCPTPVTAVPFVFTWTQGAGSGRQRPGALLNVGRGTDLHEGAGRAQGLRTLSLKTWKTAQTRKNLLKLCAHGQPIVFFFS